MLTGLRRGFLVLIAAFICAATASAHDSVRTTNPAAGQRVITAPALIELGFTAAVTTKPAAPHIAVTGPDGAHYETACASAHGQTASIPWRAGPRGVYMVRWNVIPADGHPNAGSYTFIYAGTPGPGATQAPKCSDALSSPRAGIIVLALAICLGSAGGVAALIYRERHPRRPLGYYPDDDEV